MLRGVEPVVVAVIVQALWTFGRSAVKTPLLAVLGAASLALSVAGVSPLAILVAVSGPFIPRLRQSRVASALLDGINVASLGLMAAVSFQLARAAVNDVPTALIAVAALGLLLRFRTSSTWLVLGGALVGITLSMAS